MAILSIKIYRNVLRLGRHRIMILLRKAMCQIVEDCSYFCFVINLIEKVKKCKVVSVRNKGGQGITVLSLPIKFFKTMQFCKLLKMRKP